MEAGEAEVVGLSPSHPTVHSSGGGNCPCFYVLTPRAEPLIMVAEGKEAVSVPTSPLVLKMEKQCPGH